MELITDTYNPNSYIIDELYLIEHYITKDSVENLIDDFPKSELFSTSIVIYKTNKYDNRVIFDVVSSSDSRFNARQRVILHPYYQERIRVYKY